MSIITSVKPPGPHNHIVAVNFQARVCASPGCICVCMHAYARVCMWVILLRACVRLCVIRREMPVMESIRHLFSTLAPGDICSILAVVCHIQLK